MDIEFEIGRRLELFQLLSRSARDITLPLFKAPRDIVNKASGSDYDPVTKADIDAEDVLRQQILIAFPDDGIEGEEFPNHTGKNQFIWTLDPIDGTRAFVAGVPMWTTLIALSYENMPVLGMIDVPAMDQCYMSQTYGKTKSAWIEPADNRDKNKLNTRTCPTLIEAVLGCTEPLAMFKPGEFAAYNMIRRGTRFSRLGLDAYGYAMVASGRMDIIIEAGLKPCDVRALIPIIEGAGGKLTNWHGGSAVNGGQVVAVGDEALLPELYIYLGRAMD